MGQPYIYEDLSYSVADNTTVEFTVEFVSDGNTGPSKINVSANNKFLINDSGTILIGLGKELRSGINCFSDIANLNRSEKEIRIKYKINGEIILEHSNLKTEDPRPFIELYINFPKL